MKVLISGGCRNGKSTLAQDLTLALAHGGTHYYVATMVPGDAEDRARIARHLDARAGLGFQTIECGRHILQSLNGAQRGACFLVDSLTALLANEMFLNEAIDESAPERVRAELLAFAAHVDDAVFVSDGIYADAESCNAETETYRQGLASIDRALAAQCDAVVELCAGIKTVHKGVLPL